MFILLATATGGLALVGAGRLFLLAAQAERGDEHPAALTDAPNSFNERRPALPSLPQEIAPATDDEPGSDDYSVSNGAESATEADQPPARLRLNHHALSQLVALASTTADRWLKADIIDELAARRDRAGIPTIAGLLHDADRDVRRVAANALAELDAADQVPAMRAALATESDGAIRLAFQEALHELDHASPP